MVASTLVLFNNGYFEDFTSFVSSMVTLTLWSVHYASVPNQRMTSKKIILTLSNIESITGSTTMKRTCSLLVTLLAVIWSYFKMRNDVEEKVITSKPLQHLPWVANLKSTVKGRVLIPGTLAYDEAIKVHNRVCVNTPDAVLVPACEKDVVQDVHIVRENVLELSVRSGGHSYSCTSSRQSGLQVVMRGLDKVQLLPSDESSTGWAASLGPGANWAKVLHQIPPDKWTVVHGQCLGVGVGGFLLGGGVNMVGSTARYGTGMEQVLRYRIVTAAGERLIVEKDKVKVISQSNEVHNISSEDPRSKHDLWFGLRGAGASFAIVTEFLYKVYPTPETLPAVLPVWVSNVHDLKAIEKAAWSKEGRGFKIVVNSLQYLRAARAPWMYPRHSLLKFMFDLKTFWAGEVGQPLVLSVADIREGAGRRTNVQETIKFLEFHGVRLATSSSWFLDLFSEETDTLGMIDYEGEYLGEAEKKVLGPQGMTSANMIGVVDVLSIAKVLLSNNVFGVPNKYSSAALESGCDYCFWALNFNTIPPRDPSARIALTRDVGKLQIELTCMHPPGEKKCPNVVSEVRAQLLQANLAKGGTDSQYVNTPSCQSDGWGKRYFGNNYPALLKLKEAWDPENVFNYCQSIGSTSDNCCGW